MGQWLVGSAHNPKSDMQVTVFHKGRNNGVKRTLTRRQCVGMRGIEHKESPPILEGKAHPINTHARAKTGVVALNQRSNIALFINCGQIGGVTGYGMPCAGIAICLLRIDQGGALRAIFF